MRRDGDGQNIRWKERSYSPPPVPAHHHSEKLPVLVTNLEKNKNKEEICRKHKPISRNTWNFTFTTITRGMNSRKSPTILKASCRIHVGRFVYNSWRDNNRKKRMMAPKYDCACHSRYNSPLGAKVDNPYHKHYHHQHSQRCMG